jgi:S1-C subfamily serine protease
MALYSIDSRKATTSLFVLLFVMGALVGGIGSFYLNNRQITNLSGEVTDLQSHVSFLNASTNQTVSNQTITIYQNGTSLVDIYAKSSPSVVLIHGSTGSGAVQGSGFIYNYSGKMVVLTNFHVVQDATDLSVTFSNGHGYATTVLGSDPYSDLAVLSTDDVPANELKPLNIVSSSSLRVGDQVVAIGNPYGLVGSLTTGVVSALGRSETAEFTQSFSISNMIQVSTPINPGNSGGPLLNAVGEVVGITNSVISDSQGVGFAVPSNAILREIASLVTTGSYTMHSLLGIASQPDMSDMTYDLAKQLNVDVTYGRYVGTVSEGGPSDGHLQAGDIIIAMNGTVIRNSDDLGSFLAEKTLPGDVVQITVVRTNAETTVNVTLGTRPQPNV